MGYTTADYLQALKTQKDLLVNRLTAKAVECSGNEKFNTLIKKIGAIYDTGGLAYGEWSVMENADTFTISGLNALPTSFGLSCEQIITDKVVVLNAILITFFSFSPDKETVTFYKYLDDNTFVYDSVSADLVYTTEQAADGTYTVTISFAQLNEMSAKPYVFKGGYDYNWVASSKEWFL